MSKEEIQQRLSLLIKSAEDAVDYCKTKEEIKQVIMCDATIVGAVIYDWEWTPYNINGVGRYEKLTIFISISNWKIQKVFYRKRKE